MAKGPSRERSRARAVIGLVLVAAWCALALSSGNGGAGADTSGNPDTNTRADWSPATVDATHGNTAPSTLTGAVEGRTLTVHIDGPTGKVHGATARMCRSGLDVQFTADMSPTSSGDCTPQPFQSGTDDSQVTASADGTMTNIDFQFRVGSGTQTFNYSGGSSTITCDDTHPCAIWIWEQVDSSISADGNGNNFKHYDINYAAATTSSTAATTTSTTAASTTTSSAPTTTSTTAVATTTSTSAPTTTSTSAPTTTSTSAPTTTSTSTSTTSTTAPTTTSTSTSTTSSSAPTTTSTSTSTSTTSTTAATTTTTSGGTTTTTAGGTTTTTSGGATTTSSAPTTSTSTSTSTTTSTTPLEPTDTTVTSDPESSPFGETMTVTAGVIESGGSPGTPTGTVQFLIDGKKIGDRVPLVNGEATLPINSLLPGHKISARYGGDDTYAPSHGSTRPDIVFDHVLKGDQKRLTLHGGAWLIRNANINGGLKIGPDTSVAIVHSDISGGVIADRPASVDVCGSTVGGVVNISGATGVVIIGGQTDDSCAPDNIRGGLRLDSNTGGVEVVGNDIPNGARVTNNSGTGAFPEDTATEIEHNNITGGLNCSSNSPPPTDDGRPNDIIGGGQTGQCSSF